MISSLSFALLFLALALPAESKTSEFTKRFEAYAVAADHPDASAAGAEILAKGGNAADAAAATMLALGVAHPASSGFLGGGFALYYRASDKSLTFLDFREAAPRAASSDFFADRPPVGSGSLNAASQRGGLASGIPGEPAGIVALVERFGKLSLEEVVAPSVRLARRGVRVSGHFARMGAAFARQLEEDPLMRGWLEQTRGLAAGSLLRRPTFAKTLETFGKEGLHYAYRGALAEEIVRVNREAGGVFTLEDLADYRVIERRPLEATIFGHRFVTAPPPSAGGFTLLQSLKILEALDPQLQLGRFERLHALAESWKGPYLDRQEYFGDPDHVDLPLEAMMSEHRIRARASLISLDAALEPERYAFPLEERAEDIVQSDNAGTSHFCVVDEEGNIAAVTTTVNLPFGARYSVAGAPMNDEMDDFARRVGEANAFRLIGGARNLPGPGKRPVSTMTPTIVFLEGEPILCVGASGGSRIVTATQQVAMGVLFDGLNLDWAMARARIHHQANPNTLGIETSAHIPNEAITYLEQLGHRVETMAFSANVQAIAIRDGKKPRLVAASDPRKGGIPAGK